MCIRDRHPRVHRARVRPQDVSVPLQELPGAPDVSESPLRDLGEVSPVGEAVSNFTEAAYKAALATLAEMESLGITADLAHLSAAAIDDVLALATRPTVVSHTGVRGTCDNARNLSDDQIRRIAAGGGVVGIGFWAVAACGLAPADIARAIDHVVRLVGAEHAALGSDYDGATTVGFDVSALPALTQALLDAGLTETEIRRVLGENVLRLLAGNLP